MGQPGQPYSCLNFVQVGNLPVGATRQELRDLLELYGGVTEVLFAADKQSAFIKMDILANAAQAQQALHELQYKGHKLQVRLAPNATTLRVFYCSPKITAELLEQAFVQFGGIVRAAIVDGTREGTIAFDAKQSAEDAVEYCASCLLYIGP